MSNKLSVVIITYNEERNIERCIRSVVPVADEIIVLDSYSTDNTEEICRLLGVRFFQHPFDGHIQQKNRVISYASFDYVLSLDADEALDEALVQSILEIKHTLNLDGYFMNRLTNYCGKWIYHSGWYPDKKLRLFKKNKGQWAGINPHDKFELHAGSSKPGFLKGNILHYSYYTLQDHYKQVEYFTTISANAYHASRKQAYVFHLFLNPIAKFISSYIIKLGFMDGKEGFTIARVSAYATYLKYKKLRLMQKDK